MASAVGIAALQVLKDENLEERALVLGERCRNKLREMVAKYEFVEGVRGKGLLNGMSLVISFVLILILGFSYDY